MKHLANIRHIFKSNVKMLSSCEMDFWVDESGSVIILFTDINDGMSVTNATETLAQESVKILQEIGVPTNRVRFFETYAGQDNVDEIKYTFIGGVAKSPRWTPCPDFWDLVKTT